MRRDIITGALIAALAGTLMPGYGMISIEGSGIVRFSERQWNAVVRDVSSPDWYYQTQGYKVNFDGKQLKPKDLPLFLRRVQDLKRARPDRKLVIQLPYQVWVDGELKKVKSQQEANRAVQALIEAGLDFDNVDIWVACNEPFWQMPYWEFAALRRWYRNNPQLRNILEAVPVPQFDHPGRQVREYIRHYDPKTQIAEFHVYDYELREGIDYFSWMSVESQVKHIRNVMKGRTNFIITEGCSVHAPYHGPEAVEKLARQAAVVQVLYELSGDLVWHTFAEGSYMGLYMLPGQGRPDHPILTLLRQGPEAFNSQVLIPLRRVRDR